MLKIHIIFHKLLGSPFIAETFVKLGQISRQENPLAEKNRQYTKECIWRWQGGIM